MKDNRAANAAKQIAAALIAIQHLLDRPGDVVFRIAQLDLQLGVALALDLDQILETQGDKLVTVLDQDIKIGIGDRRLIAGGRLEGHGPDTVFLPCLLFQLRLFLGIDELDLDPALAGHFVLAEQIAQLRLQRGQKRMGLGREIAADKERLLQPVQVGTSGG